MKKLKINLPTIAHYQVLARYLLILSILDAVFTDVGIRLNLISEANPIIDFIYTNNIIAFYILKIGLPLMLIYIVKFLHESKAVTCVSLIAIFVYTLVLIYHLSWSLYIIPNA